MAENTNNTQNREIQKRQVAYKCLVSSIINSEFVVQEGFNPNYLTINNKQVSRVNIIGTIVNIEQNEQNMKYVLDDTTGSIDLVVFERIAGLDEIKVGSVVNIIGRPRRYNNDKFIMPEIIKNIDPAWLKVRLKECKEYKIEKKIEPKIMETKVVEEMVLDEGAVGTEVRGETDPVEKKEPEKVEVKISKSEILFEGIQNLDKGDGVSYGELAAKIKLEELDELINSLLERGEIFEISPGKYKILE